MSCSRMRDLIVYYGVYKAMLDRICRRKRINNYMVLPETVRRNKSEEETSAYYKDRLYQYTNKYGKHWDSGGCKMTVFRFSTRQREEDGYIQTYKVGRRKQELDKLVIKGLKKFSIIGV